MFATRSVGRGWASTVAIMAAVAVVASVWLVSAPVGQAAGPGATPSCAAAQIRSDYAVVPFSQGTGIVSYLLTVRNRSQQTCTLTAPLSMQLLDRGRRALPTRVNGDDGSYEVVLAPGQWAQAPSRFSPDIAGPGENASECEPPAHFLALEIGNGHVLARMDPSPVCEDGTIDFGRLTAVPPTPVCHASSIVASFEQASPPYDGSTAYYLVLRNLAGAACQASSFARLTLLDGAGDPVPTRMSLGIASPYIIPTGGEEYAVATLRTTPGPDEPARGACEPLATHVRIATSRRSGAVTVPIEPPLHACHGGTITLSGLYPAVP